MRIETRNGRSGAPAGPRPKKTDVSAGAGKRRIRRSTPFTNAHCYKDAEGKLRCLDCDGLVRGLAGYRRCSECGEDEETYRVIEGMAECWPGATDYNYVRDDRVEILDKDDHVLAVMTGDELTQCWNGL